MAEGPPTPTLDSQLDNNRDVEPRETVDGQHVAPEGKPETVTGEMHDSFVSDPALIHSQAVDGPVDSKAVTKKTVSDVALPVPADSGAANSLPEHNGGVQSKGVQDIHSADPASTPTLSLIHISEPTRQTVISYAVFCL